MGINQSYKYWELSFSQESDSEHGIQEMATHWSEEWQNIKSLLQMDDDAIKSLIEDDIRFAREHRGNSVTKRSIEPALKEFKKIIEEHGFVRNIPTEHIKLKTINELCMEAYKTACSKGWYDPPKEFGTSIGLIHTEVKEAYDAENLEDYAEELADILIRIFDLCGYNQLPLESSFKNITYEITLEDVYSQLFYLNEEESKEYLLFKLHNMISTVLKIYSKKDDGTKSIKLSNALVDICLYVLQISKTYNLAVIESMHNKMQKNKERPYKHGDKII